MAGRSTFSPTRRSHDWEHMALPRVPDFSAFSEEDLFDEKEDVHFLTEKSPWKGAGAVEAESIPEGHEVRDCVRDCVRVYVHVCNTTHAFSIICAPPPPQYYKPGPLGEDGAAAAAADRVAAAAADPNIYFEDAAYRPSWLDKIYQGAWDDFHPSQVPDDEVEHLRELAERYEEQLFAILSQREGAQDEDAGGKAPAFDPKAFEDEMDGLGGGKSNA